MQSVARRGLHFLLIIFESKNVCCGYMGMRMPGHKYVIAIYTITKVALFPSPAGDVPGLRHMIDSLPCRRPDAQH